jgi:hypothetical protein
MLGYGRALGLPPAFAGVDPTYSTRTRAVGVVGDRTR